MPVRVKIAEYKLLFRKMVATNVTMGSLTQSSEINFGTVANIQALFHAFIQRIVSQ